MIKLGLCAALAVILLVNVCQGEDAQDQTTAESVSSVTSTEKVDITTTTAVPGPEPEPSPTPMGPVCTAVSENPNAPPKPILPKTWSAHVEAKIEWHGESVEVPYWCDMEQYVDLDGKQKQAYLHAHSGMEQHTIYDYSTGSKVTINTKDSKCGAPESFTSSAFLDLNIDFPMSGGSNSPEAILFFDGGIVEQFVNDSQKIRGIPVSHWTSCLECISDSCTGSPVKVDYYFSNEHYDSPSGLQKVPIRAEFTRHVKDSNTPPNTVVRKNVYDFTSWRNKVEDRNSELFQVPCGVVCPASTTTKSVPQLSDFFTLTTESIFPDESYTFVTKEHHDYSLKLSRYDWTPSHHHDSEYGPMYGYAPITVIHDFNGNDNNGNEMLEYVLIQHNSTCNIHPITLTNKLPDVGNNSDTIVMNHGKQLFDMADDSLVYQGEKTWRNIQADVWASDNQGIIEEYFFAKENWFSTSAQSPAEDQKQALIGIRRITDDGTGNLTTVIFHMVDYLDETGQSARLEPFNIRSCFTPQQQKHFRVQVAGSFEQYVSGRKSRYITNEVRKELSKRATISEIRITDIYFDESDNGKLDIWMTMLGAPAVTGGSGSMTTLEDAFKHLKIALDADTGISLNIPYPAGEQKLLIESGSLREAGKGNPDPRPNNDPKKKGGHSSASMGALGFFMLLIGAVVGVGVGYWMWNRRGRGIPYSVQH